MTNAASGRNNLAGFLGNGTVAWPDVLVVDGTQTKTLLEADPWETGPSPVNRVCDLPVPTNKCLMSRKLKIWGGTKAAGACQVYDPDVPGQEGSLVPFDGLWARVFKSGVKLRIPEAAAPATPSSHLVRRAVMSLSLNSRQGRALLPLTMYFALAFQSIPGYCAGIIVGNGASFHVGNATIDVNCLNLETAGQFVLGGGLVNAVNLLSIESTGELSGDTGSLRFAGGWWNAGTFNAAQSSVSMQDGCGTAESLMLGDNSFYNFSASTSTGKVFSIEAGSIQTFSNELSLHGAEPNQRLKIRSSVTGQSVHFNLAAQGVQQINAVDVKDNDATAGQLLAPGIPAAHASVDAGNNKNWFEQLSDLLFRDSFESD